MSKVYCDHCKYSYAKGIEGWCAKNPEVKDSWDSRWAKYAECRLKNNNNDCKDFESNLRQRIKKWLSVSSSNL